MKFLYIAARFFHLLSIPGVAGYEQPVREAIELALPLNARVRADNMGNIVLRTGSGSPHTLVVAPLDEGGLVVSAISDDGYLRAHRHTLAPSARLVTQYVIGQPVEIRTANGRTVPGVTATPSTHLNAFRDAQDRTRVQDLDDVWIDVGADSAAAVEKLGIRMLDMITLRERATLLADGRVSGVGAAGRAAAMSLVELASRRQPGPQTPGAVTIAWVVQSEYGQRGLARLMETMQPDRVIFVRGVTTAGTAADGAVGVLGSGPVVSDDRKALAAVVPPAIPLEILSVPVLFAQTPVETIDARDIDAIAQSIATKIGFGQLAEPAPPTNPTDSTNPTNPTDPTFEPLATLIETYGVSGHEAPVRAEVLKRIPAWAQPVVDAKGNIRVTMGPESGKAVVFIAHLDEVGFEIASINADGSATIRARGGMYLSLYEAHPVVVHTTKGMVPAIVTPRQGYTTATTAQPTIEQLTLYFGTSTAEATRALGVAEGQSATVRKKFVTLAGGRATGRAMDDRNGSTALLLALARIDPAKLTSRVTFAWAVEEETGLAGAQAIASELVAHTAFAIDTFVSSDAPLDSHRVAGARLGYGAVLRGLDSRTIVQSGTIDRIVAIARARKIAMQIGVTSGGTDASAFSAGGAIDVGLSWPGRYSHSPIEVMDRKDLLSLVDLIAALALEY